MANCDSSDPDDIQRFSQPVIQTVQMFIGEMGCWLVVGCVALYQRYASPSSTPLIEGGYAALDDRAADPEQADEDGEDGVDRMGASFSSLEPHNPVVKSLLPEVSPSGRIELKGWRVIVLALPACCDIVATTFMNAGLLFVAASIYQMTRGALVLFVGVFSVIFLKRRLAAYQWFALLTVVAGVAIVGLAGAVAPNPQAQPEPRSLMHSALVHPRSDANRIKTTEVSHGAVLVIGGVFMIALAQIFTATQFVLEEFILHKYELQPLRVVGWEGLFGFFVTVVAMIVLHLAIGRTEQGRNGYFDAVEGWRQVTQNRAIAVTSILIMLSIGGFNFFGLSVTRSLSSTSRSTIDTCRTLFIWIVSLGLGWETFKWLQIVGFALLVYGTFLFNDLVQPPLQACLRREKPSELLSEEAARNT